MKILKSLLLITAISGTATFARSDSPTPANQPFSITISAPNTTVWVGSDIYIKARLRNTSNQPISAGGVAHSQGVDTGYQYFCRNSATGESRRNKDFESGVLERVGESPLLKPDESYESLVPVNRACDMSKPGRYVIQLSRSLPSDNRVVKSNAITVTVTNDESVLAAAPPSFELSIGAYSNGRPSETNVPFVVKAGEDVGVTITKTITSAKEVDCSRVWSNLSGLDEKYSFDVRDSDGNPVAKHSIAGPLPYMSSFDQRTCRQGEAPGVSSNNSITRLFDLSKPGNYTIQVSQPVSDNPADGVVKSDTITVTVTP